MTETETAVLDGRTVLLAALLTVRQMAQADRLAVVCGISGTELMENAGRPVARTSRASDTFSA